MISKNTDAKKKNVTVEITNVQTMSDSADTLTQKSNGTFVTLGEKKHVYYTADGEKNALTVSDGRVSILRTQSGSAMIFEKGRETVSEYMTPYGKIPMTFVTKNIIDNIANNGTLLLEYTLNVGNNEPIYNKMTINIKEI